MSIIEDNPQSLFDRWYKKPLIELEKLPNGDGGFVVLATCCFLYERYAKSVLKSKNKKANYDNLIQQLCDDFCINDQTADAFWKVIRNGFLHQGMPVQQSQGEMSFPSWQTCAVFEVPIKLVEKSTQLVLQIQPWLFRDHIFKLYEASPEFIKYNQSFPWAIIWEETL